jgi:hypothetical protein
VTSTNVTFLRWRRGEPRAGRTFAGPEPDHPAHAASCVACGERLGDGRAIQVVAIGPDPDDAEDVLRDARGLWYSAVAVIIHADDVADLGESGLERLVGQLALAPSASGAET